MQRVLTLLFSVVFIHISFSQNTTKPVLTAKKVVSQQVWVDSIYNQFSFEEKEVNTITKENNPIVVIAFFIIWGFLCFCCFYVCYDGDYHCIMM